MDVSLLLINTSPPLPFCSQQKFDIGVYFIHDIYKRCTIQKLKSDINVLVFVLKWGDDILKLDHVFNNNIPIDNF